MISLMMGQLIQHHKSLMKFREIHLLTNLLYKNDLNDMDTGCNIFRKNISEQLQIKAEVYNFETEFTAKLLK